MLTKETIIAKFVMNIENKKLSIATDTIIKDDDVEISRSRHMCAFIPGDIDKVIHCLGKGSEEVKYLKNIWTDEVVQAYKDMIAAQDV